MRHLEFVEVCVFSYIFLYLIISSLLDKKGRKTFLAYLIKEAERQEELVVNEFHLY